MYCNKEDVKSELGINDAKDDPALDLAIGAAQRQIDAECGWLSFTQDTAVQTRFYFPDDYQTLSIPEGISTTTGLVVKLDTDDNGTYETTLTRGTDFQLLPINASNQSWPWTEISLIGSNYWFMRSAYNRALVSVTAKFGWPAVPDDIKKACVIQAAQLFKAKDAVFGVLSLGDAGGVMRVRGGLNPLAAGLIERYARPRVG